jgi:hypothetical protein
MTRLPVVVVLAAALAGAVAVDGARDDPNADATGASAVRPGTLMPASPPADVGSSTWYCAAGTAVEGGMADHTVTVLNPTDDELAATLTVFAGDIAHPGTAGAGAAEPAPTMGADPAATTTVDPEATTTATPAAGAAAAVRSTPVTEQVALPAGERVDVRLGDFVEAPLAAALVEVDGGDVAVEHRVAGEHGVDAGACSTFTAPTWHLAWGATTRDARDIVVLFNPFPSSATVDAVFTTEDGRREPVRFQGFPVPAGSVVGVDLGDDVTRSEQVSATFEARSGRVVVEQLQQYDGSLGTRGLSLTLGVPAAGETWVFADGEASAPGPTTPAPGEVSDDGDDGDDNEVDGNGEADGDREGGGNDGNDDNGGDGNDGNDDNGGDGSGGGDGNDELITTERIVVYNPGDERAEVEVSVVPTTDEPAPVPQPFRLSVGSGGYEVIDYGAQDRIAAGVPHTTVVRSTNGRPVVPERVTVDEGPAPRSQRTTPGSPPAPPGEIAATHGSRLSAPVWRFPSVAGADGSSVAFVVFNPDPGEAVEVRLDLLADTAAGEGDENDDPLDEDGEGAVGPTAPVSVPPGARVAIELDTEQAADALAAVVDAGGPVVVDRVVRLADGRRRTLGPGVPGAGDAVLLDRLADAGMLGGATPGRPTA